MNCDNRVDHLDTVWKMKKVFWYGDTHTQSIMSGDSPNSHRNEIFDFSKEGRISPGPTTSKDPTGAQSTTVVQASVIVEPDKEDDDKLALCSPILNNSNADDTRVSDADKTVQLDELSYSDKKKRGEDENKDEKKKLNGDIDKLDGVWIPSQDTRKKPVVEEDDENCAVKCLYYTMQCCECVIV